MNIQALIDQLTVLAAVNPNAEVAVAIDFSPTYYADQVPASIVSIDADTFDNPVIVISH